MKALLASARAAGLSGDDAARVPGLASEPVWRAITLRLERLPEGARALAHAAAVLGRDATAARAAAVAGVDHFTGLEAADTLRRAEILGSSHSTLRFRHGIVRESIYAGLPPRDRARAHVRAARALSEEGGAPENTAEHLLQAQRIGEPWAIGVLREAGRSALAGGRPERGIAYLRRALDEEPAGPDAGRSPGRARRGGGRIRRSGRRGAAGAGRRGLAVGHRTGADPRAARRSALATRAGGRRHGGVRARLWSSPRAGTTTARPRACRRDC